MFCQEPSPKVRCIGYRALVLIIGMLGGQVMGKWVRVTWKREPRYEINFTECNNNIVANEQMARNVDTIMRLSNYTVETLCSRC
ncbi:hypothetical protein BDY19DRAFT_674043 [Irpex rosettiformis]|uniref:Uncharacterized protein n=1 Tax=Irpex rosettiformis TaxID=378272 RepID=A0ACB8U9W3_9APHY|nr:hypothetical protein BDY19DRAFT_674043 [Irpex rosettiformis]